MSSHQHLDRLRDRRQADTLVARQRAHRAGAAADPPQRRPLRELDRLVGLPQVRPEHLRHQVDDVNELGRDLGGRPRPFRPRPFES